MNSKTSSEPPGLRWPTDLDLFVQRAIRLGVVDIRELIDLVPNKEIQRALLEIADIDPTKGRAETAADLVAEIQAREEEDEPETLGRRAV